MSMLNKTSADALAVGAAGLGWGAYVLSQVAPSDIESVGVWGAIIGTVALAIRTFSEIARHYITYKEAALRVDELQAEIVRLRAQVASLQDQLARAESLINDAAKGVQHAVAHG